MDKAEIMNIVVDQLKPLIEDGQFLCMKCHRPLDGSDINHIDVEEMKVWYSCPVENCHNNGRMGYRTFRTLKIVLPTRDVPTDILETRAPPPPEPEEVEWEETEDDVSDDEYEDEADQEI